MGDEYLQELYQKGHLRRGHSVEVDQAITDIVQLSTDQIKGVPNPLARNLPPIPPDELTRRWSRFVAVVATNFPDIEPYNITAITTFMTAEKHFQEELFLRQLIEALCPSSESACFLGHAYGHLGEYEQALSWFREAYRRVTKFAQAAELDPTNPHWLDAADYMRDAAECQLELNRPAEALMSLVSAVGLVKEAGEYAAFKRKDLTELFRSVMQAAGWTPDAELWETAEVTA